MKKTLKLIALLLLSSMHWTIAQTSDSSLPKDGSPKNLSAKEINRLKGEDAKHLAPAEGKALVFIVRPTIMAFAIPMRVDCDSFQVGWISAKTFLYTMLDPGSHTLKALAENEFHLDINLEAGKTYYFEEQIKMGFAYARTKLKQLDEEEGKKKLDKCSISGTNRYPNFPLSRDIEKTPPKD
jgi:hypothetical protein